MQHQTSIKAPITGLAVLAVLGPSIVWASEYIGSGEVILATRNGAIFGTGIIWVVISGIFLKFWIGMSGARYTVCTGEGMIDMFARMPGPRNWAVWIVLVAQFISATISIGSIATAAGVFLGTMLPISHSIGGWIVTVLAFLVAWVGKFNWIKVVMSFLVLIMIAGVFWVAVAVFPGWTEFFKGLIPHIPAVPEWAVEQGVNRNPWKEILPLLGWGAGGFASQVWYSYWVMGAGYGAAKKDVFGKPADIVRLKDFGREDARKLLGWCRIVYYDSTFAIVLGIAITLGFIIAGAGVLGPAQLAPSGEHVGLQLSSIFSSNWGSLGGFLFLLGGTAALMGTQVGQLAGWPRLLADTFRICIPWFGRKLSWIIQFRLFLVFFFLSNMIIVYSFNLRPVALIKLGALLDGLLLTPLQALWVGIGLYLVLPRLFKPEVGKMLRPHWVIGAGLIIAFLVFGYFCVAQLPAVF
ncbi:Nramp family divalent metal transporter [Bacteroidota bacterium]